MAYQGGGCAAPADFGDRKLSRLTVGTRKQRHRDRFRVRQLDHPRRRPPNVDLSPREYFARPSLRENFRSLDATSYFLTFLVFDWLAASRARDSPTFHGYSNPRHRRYVRQGIQRADRPALFQEYSHCRDAAVRKVAGGSIHSHRHDDR